MIRKLILCDCLGSQELDPELIERSCGVSCSKVYSALCMDQIADAAREISGEGAVVACQQERQRFEELAEETGAEIAGFVDLRDRAGWGEGAPGPKMAALVAEALLSDVPDKSIDVVSEGACLILGGDAALRAAEDLCEILAVTVLLTGDTPLPGDRRFDCIRGTLRQASGAFGGFSVMIDGFRQVIPGGRGETQMTAPRDGALSECDIILDLDGGSPLFPAPDKREGYLRADPGSGPAVSRAVLQASQMLGTFEKPLYVRMEPSLCAHSRAEKPACSRCLNVCPTGAISPAGEFVSVDPMICAGCGSCSAVCPSGAISYDAPPVDRLFRRLSTLAETFRSAGGTSARLLVHDATHGREMISLAARFGRGLPAEVIPFETEALSGFGHAEMLAALACGFDAVDILLSPRTEREVIDAQAALCEAIAGEGKLRLIDAGDPDALCDLLYGEVPSPFAHDPVLPIGTRRQITRLAAKALQPEADMLPLPPEAPYGAVLVDTGACTLCLSCVSLCPSGALGENPDKPQLRFQEDACLQCGLCANICPESAITLEPRLNLTDAAFTQVVLHEEEPFACIECGKLFGVKSTVERITEKLAGKHSMFGNPDAARMIQMCEDCRVQAQFHATDNPFQGGERPAVRTTADYLSKRKDH